MFLEHEGCCSPMSRTVSVECQREGQNWSTRQCPEPEPNGNSMGCTILIKLSHHIVELIQHTSWLYCSIIYYLIPALNRLSNILLKNVNRRMGKIIYKSGILLWGKNPRKKYLIWRKCGYILRSIKLRATPSFSLTNLWLAVIFQLVVDICSPRRFTDKYI